MGQIANRQSLVFSERGQLSQAIPQRAANGGLDPWWLDLAFLGRPTFPSRGPKTLILKGFGTSGRKSGAPQKRQIQPRRIQPPILGPLNIPQVHVERILHQRTPIARFESQCNERRVYEDQILCFRKRHDRQRTLVIRVAAITLASDSAITLARFRPSKVFLKGGALLPL